MKDTIPGVYIYIPGEEVRIYLAEEMWAAPLKDSDTSVVIYCKLRSGEKRSRHYHNVSFVYEIIDLIDDKE
jgi:hypothetical protein